LVIGRYITLIFANRDDDANPTDRRAPILDKPQRTVVAIDDIITSLVCRLFYNNRYDAQIEREMDFNISY